MRFLSGLFRPSFEEELVRRITARPEAAAEIVVDGVRCWVISDQLMAALATLHGVTATPVKVDA